MKRPGSDNTLGNIQNKNVYYFKKGIQIMTKITDN
jgi:hypothetical protein